MNKLHRNAMPRLADRKLSSARYEKFDKQALAFNITAGVVCEAENVKVTMISLLSGYVVPLDHVHPTLTVSRSC